MSSVVRKSKIRRLEPVTDRALARAPRIPRRIRRRALLGVAIAVGLAVLIPLALWVRYRVMYVVSSNAMVKGQITHVGAQLDGVVTSVEVDAGEQVKAGQVLARFEDHQLQATVQRAQSRLDKAMRELEVEHLAIDQERRRFASLLTEASARSAAAAAQVEAAQSQADDARLRHELRQSMAKTGIITQEELRTAEASSRTSKALGATARADAKAARAAHQLAQVESDGLAVRQAHLVVLDADVAGFRAELALAQADLDAAVIRAPGDGWVVRRIAEPGGSVVVGQPVVALWIGKEVWVEAWINEDDLGSVAAGNSARVTLKSFPDRVFAGTVETVGMSTDYELPDTVVPDPRTTRMRAAPVVCVRIALSDAEGVFPGLSAVVGIRRSKS